MEEWILQLIEYFKQLSYFGITIALTFEFIPAELVLPLVGYWVYQGDMNLYLAILFGSIGGVTGPLTLYFLGKYGGRPLVLKFGKYFFIREKDILKSEEFFRRYGLGIAFFGRFIPGIRTAISLPCGLMKMNIWKFILYTYIAMLPVTSLYIYTGYKLGPQWEKTSSIVSNYLNDVLFFVLILMIFFVAKSIYQKYKRIKSPI